MEVSRRIPANGKTVKKADEIFPYTEKYQRNQVYPDEPESACKQIKHSVNMLLVILCRK